MSQTDRPSLSALLSHTHGRRMFLDPIVSVAQDTPAGIHGLLTARGISRPRRLDSGRRTQHSR